MPICFHCRRTIEASEGDFYALRSADRQCWEKLPWQVKVRNVVLGCLAKGVPIWDEEYVRLSDLVLEVLGGISAPRDSVIRLARYYSEPADAPPGYEMYEDRQFWHFTIVHPKSWRMRHLAAHSKSRFSSPESGERRMSIGVSVIYVPPEVSARRTGTLANAFQESFSQQKGAVFEEARDSVVDGYPALSTSATFKSGILFKRELFGLLTAVDAGNRFFSLHGTSSLSRMGDLEAVWQVFQGHLRIWPAPDPAYIAYLRATLTDEGLGTRARS